MAGVVAVAVLVCILQSIRPISITGGVPTSFIPLSFVLFFDGIVTAREDYKRHRDDAIANSRLTRVLRGRSFQEAAWKDVQVGDIVKVRLGAVAIVCGSRPLRARGDVAIDVPGVTAVVAAV